MQQIIIHFIILLGTFISDFKTLLILYIKRKRNAICLIYIILLVTYKSIYFSECTAAKYATQKAGRERNCAR